MREVQLRARRSGGSRYDRTCGDGGGGGQRWVYDAGFAGTTRKRRTHGVDELEGERHEAEHLERRTTAVRLLLVVQRLLDRLLRLLNRVHCVSAGSSVPRRGERGGGR